MPNTLTPHQALLLLHQAYATEPARRRELELLIMVGSYSVERVKRLAQLWQDPHLAGYTIDSSPAAIQQDPVRRFFETQLAFFTLKQWLSRLSLAKLDALATRYYANLPESALRLFQHTLFAEFNAFPLTICVEYSDVLKELRSVKSLSLFSSYEKAALHYIFVCAFLSVLLAGTQPLPLNIYHQGWFQASLRGLVTRVRDPATLITDLCTTPDPTATLQTQDTVRSHARGILTSLMPLPRESVVWRNCPPHFVRAPDRSHYDPNSALVNLIFQQQVHPFVNSISGTMLCTLRSLLFLLETKQLLISQPENIHNVLRCTMAALLYFMGGHSLLEFCWVLHLPEVTEAFKPYISFGTCSLMSLFMEKNDTALNNAIVATYPYQQHWLQRQRVHHELQARFATTKA